MIEVLHILERLAGDGPSRSLLAAVEGARQLGLPQRHSLCTLEPRAHPLLRIRAHRAGLQVLLAPTGAALEAAMRRADIVQVHWWNSPAMDSFLRRELPPVRLLVWLKVLGRHPPQVLTPGLVAWADRIVATASATLRLPVVASLSAAERAHRFARVPGIASFSRLDGFRRQPHPGTCVGYLGTLHPSKMHPRFVALGARLSIPELTVVACGGGGGEVPLRARAEARGQSARFRFGGYVEDIRPVLAAFDIFGYPLCADTYATSEKSLQEAMAVGIPPVVLPHGGVCDLVEHERTGLIAADEDGYVAAVERLAREPALRRVLGGNARRFVRRIYSRARAVRAFDELYRELLTRPRRARHGRSAGDGAAARFVAALGSRGGPFAASLTSATPPLAEEASIARASPLLLHGTGGILHWAGAAPDDPHLRLWSGLGLLAGGRPEAAWRALEAARARGLTHWRVAWYQAQAAESAGDLVRTRAQLAEVSRAAPEFGPAKQRARALGLSLPKA